ncbi:MAG: phosphatase PAP2 family protein [Alphaproteobacteria bacterium]|nr:phosphatase PAP2 family protein [Alphaproteobacteria bacterium]
MRVKALKFSSSDNLSRWSVNIRRQIFVGEFLRNLDWEIESAKSILHMKWASMPFFKLKRPTARRFAQELPYVRDYADQRADRSAEILSQLDSITDYFAMVLGLTGSRNPFTLELIGLVSHLAGQAVMIPKHVMACRRPDELDGRLMPLIPTPGHSSFPSGHATQAAAVSTVLQSLLSQCPDHFPDHQERISLIKMMAHRIAVNRTVAGVHFPIDSWAGAFFGTKVGEIFTAAAGTKVGHISAACFEPSKTKGDFFFDDMHEAQKATTDQSSGGSPKSKMIKVDKSDELGWLWRNCIAEFAVGARRRRGQTS